jgi:probable rRNA maturation factor
MSYSIENEYGIIDIPDYDKVICSTIEQALDFIECPYECEINILLTNNHNIKNINNEQRNIDNPTDVLSFPLINYNIPGDFSIVEENSYDYFNPETGELLLGDIIISIDKVYEQADTYNHSRTRELAFLVAHSMLHLFGYDHIEDEERRKMEDLQEKILTMKGYTRDYEEK